MAPATDNLTLDELRLLLAPAIADAAVFDGWSDAAVASAAAQHGVDPATARLAMQAGEGQGAMALIAAWIDSIDATMATVLPAETLVTMKIRARINALVQFRLDHMAPQKEALRRALAIMAMPQNTPAALRMGWRTADRMWRLAGDTATDYNHYTKRMTLGALYGSVLAVFAEDTSADHAETRGFLARRIENVMQFERAKAQILRPDAEHFSMARFLGRLRYPAA